MDDIRTLTHHQLQVNLDFGEHPRSRRVTVEVLQEQACIQLMEEFIAAEPQLWNEDIGVPDS